MLGTRRRADDLAAVFCSDLGRAFRTAEIAFGQLSAMLGCGNAITELHKATWQRAAGADL